MVALMYAARKRIVITTPYFIPDAAILQALETAVRRGVQVHLVVSRQADQYLVSLAQRKSLPSVASRRRGLAHCDTAMPLCGIQQAGSRRGGMLYTRRRSLLFDYRLLHSPARPAGVSPTS